MKRVLLITMIFTLFFKVIPAYSAGLKSEWGFGYAAVAGHYFQQEYANLMPNKIDQDGYLVRLPTYFSLSRTWEQGDASKFAQVAYFKNCYLDPSLAITYAEKLDDYSLEWMDVRVGGVLYVRQIPRDDENRRIDDFWGEIQINNVGYWLMPAIIFSIPITEYWRAELGISGVAIGQLRFVF